MAEINKKSFVIHLDMLDVIDEMDDKQAGKLFKVIRAYQLRLSELRSQDIDTGNDWAVNDFVTKIAFAPFKAQFDRDLKNYYGTVEKNKQNAQKRWAKEKPPTDATGINRIPQHAKNADNDNDSDSDNDNDNVSVYVARPQKVKFKDSIFFEKEKFRLARPKICALWPDAVPDYAKDVLHAELLKWSENSHAMRTDDNWILEAYTWYSRNTSKYKKPDTNGKTISIKPLSESEAKTNWV